MKELIFETQIRVRYSETDQMGYVYYGNYGAFLEVGRCEAIRALGLSYKDIEDLGIMMPVVDMSLKYHRPAKYDDLLTVRSIIRKAPSVKFVFEYEIYNQRNELLTTAVTTLAIIDMKTNRPCKAPEFLINLFNSYSSL